MCQTADYLRWQLYQAARRYVPSVVGVPSIPDAVTLAAIRANQSEQPHVWALQALMFHLAEHGCERGRDESY